METNRKIAMLKVGAILLCALVILRHAWICDDAFITLRTARNLLDGYGLRWNLHERVQSYTHPLWMFVLSAFWAPTREPVAATLLPSMGLCLATLYLIAFRLKLSAPAALLALACAISSKSFVDYSTSGLENSLTHFLFALLAADYLRWTSPERGLRGLSRRQLLRLTFWLALMALCRPDAILLGLPVLVVACRRTEVSHGTLAKTLATGLAPLLAWAAFATVYYGFPFPNTAYAKLASGVRSSDLWWQGSLYYLSQIAFDPISILAIAGAFAAVVVTRDRRLYPLGLGLAFYLLYIVSIGGDFMAGRYFSLPVVVASVMLASALSGWLDGSRPAAYLPAAVMTVAGLVLPAHPTLSMNVDYELKQNPVSKQMWDERGVCDERAFYSVSMALLRTSRSSLLPNNWHKARGESLAANSVETMAQVGVAGFFAPPTAIIVDSYGLTDAFVARLPAANKVVWRPGHYARDLPAGYIESLKQGQNVITGREAAWLFDRIKSVVSDPVWSWKRWKEILRLNLGLSPDTIEWNRSAKGPVARPAAGAGAGPAAANH